jgi:hypothetical protein
MEATEKDRQAFLASKMGRAMLEDLQARRERALATVVGASGPAAPPNTPAALRDSSVYARGRLDETDDVLKTWFEEGVAK